MKLTASRNSQVKRTKIWS